MILHGGRGGIWPTPSPKSTTSLSRHMQAGDARTQRQVLVVITQGAAQRILSVAIYSIAVLRLIVKPMITTKY